METLTYEDYIKILTTTEYNLLDQALELLRVEGLDLAFEQKAIDAIAQISVELNEEDNIGARWLWTVLDAVLEDINFDAPDIEDKNQM